jgi:hypothetical protein
VLGVGLRLFPCPGNEIGEDSGILTVTQPLRIRNEMIRIRIFEKGNFINMKFK